MKASETPVIVANISRSRYITNMQGEDQLSTLSPFLISSFHNIDRFGSVRLVKTVQPEINLVVNGSFEDASSGKIAGWTSPAGTSIDTGFFQNGKQSIKVSLSDFGTSTAMQNISLKPGTTYQISFFYRTENMAFELIKEYGVLGSVRLRMWADKNYWFVNSREISTEWTKNVVTFKTVDNLSDKPVVLDLGLVSAKGTAWFDDIRLIEVKK